MEIAPIYFLVLIVLSMIVAALDRYDLKDMPEATVGVCLAWLFFSAIFFGRLFDWW